MSWTALLPKNWKEVLAWVILAVAMSVATHFGIGVFTPPAPPIPIWIDDDGKEHQVHYGWSDLPTDVATVVKSLKFQTFGDTEAGKADDPLPSKVYLWQAYKLVDARGPPAKNQKQVGSCVSFGTNNAIIRTMAFEIAILKKPFDLQDIAEEVTYAGSRVEVGKGRISGDGSVGAWAADFVKGWGIVSRKKYPTADLSSYDEARCRAWGRTGVPDDLEATAREHPVQTITQVRTWEEAKRALANGYGIAICSNQGFSMQRDSRGVAAPQGNWAHCMCLDGFHVEGSQEFGHIENSWGDSAHKGPVGWGDPSTAGFWASSGTVSRMLAAGDSWAFSSTKGFPARRLDWFVRLEQKQRQEVVNRLTLAFPGKGRYSHAFSAN